MREATLSTVITAPLAAELSKAFHFVTCFICYYPIIGSDVETKSTAISGKNDSLLPYLSGCKSVNNFIPRAKK
jgi:hypothetical protein